MGRSLAKIWIHLIYTTKNRAPVICSDTEKQIFPLIRSEIERLSCQLIALNGTEDHLHLLFRLHSSVSLADFVKQAKGATAYHYNANTEEPIVWQEGYAAYSVSENRIYNVKKYIDNQKAIHRKRSLAEELEIFQQAGE